ncbi:MAG TPA: PEP-CTERM sorting domain-containing protein, partial [Gemmataceae bacterium]
YSGGTASTVTQLTPGGAYLITALGVNNSGRVIGPGVNPSNPAVNVGYVLDTATNTAFSVGALPGMNGALNFAVSDSGAVVGTSMLNQGAGLPFIWTDAGGMVAIPLAAGTSQGSALAVNSAGWAVGTDSSAFAVPFLYDGATTYRLGDLIPAGSGWDLLTNTSSSAMGISDGGVIVGTGVFNGNVHAYAMVPVPEPGTLAFGVAAAGCLAAWRRRGRCPGRACG